MRLRAWEPNETHWFVNSLRRGDTVLDIGANVGYYTVIAAKLVGESGRVYAFDPDPSSFSLLKRNVRLNGLQNVVLEQKAVSNESGSIRLYLADENKGDHRIFETSEARQFVEVEAVTLDEYFEDYAGRIDFVKIDTQGAEAAIVEGMRGLLEKNPEVVMAVEFDPSALDAFGYEAAAFLDGLGNSGFRFYDLGEWSMVGPLKKVAAAALLRRFTVENEQFTNLLLTRGRMPRGHRAQKQQRYLEW
jgi:FkbM family methyltransferase